MINGENFKIVMNFNFLIFLYLEKKIVQRNLSKFEKFFNLVFEKFEFILKI